MYGVPADLPLDEFVGKEINVISFTRFRIQLCLIGAGTIDVGDNWELRDRSGSLIDSERDHGERDGYRVHQILDVPIVGFSIDPPRSFTLIFESGHRLEIFDDSEQYESFAIYLDGKSSWFI